MGLIPPCSSTCTRTTRRASTEASDVLYVAFRSSFSALLLKRAAFWLCQPGPFQQLPGGTTWKPRGTVAGRTPAVGTLAASDPPSGGPRARGPVPASRATGRTARSAVTAKCKVRRATAAAYLNPRGRRGSGPPRACGGPLHSVRFP